MAMKIGVDARSLEEERTGIGRYLSNLLREWASIGRGHAFRLYFLGETPREPSLDAPHFHAVRLSVEAPFDKAPFYPELEREPVDVFFSPLYDLPRALALPAVITVHDMVYEAYPDSYTEVQLDYLRATTAFSIPYARRIVTDSAFARGEILARFPGVGGKIAVIPLAQDPSFREIDDREGARAILREKYALHHPFFLSVGSIAKKRHIVPLVEAFARVRRRRPDLQLFLGGRNLLVHPEALGEAVARCNAGSEAPAVIYLPYIPEEDLLLLYNTATAFVYLSEYEGFGMPPLEAMACGAPVLTTPFSSLPEVVGDAAYVVDPSREGAVEDALLALAADAPLRVSLIERGRARVRLFSWSRTASETLRVIEEARG